MKEINQVKYICYITIDDATKYSWPVGLVVWFSLRVREAPGSTPGQALLPTYMWEKIELFTDTAAILILPPGHHIVLIENYSFFCSDNAALSQ